MIAVLSDIHSNLTALKAVMKDISARGISRIFFLGDLVGYGPNPFEVLAFLDKFEISLRGNHDGAVLFDIPDNFNPVARRASEWTRTQVDPAYHKNPLAMRQLKAKRIAWRKLQLLPIAAELNGMKFFHDTPVAPGSSLYVRDIYDAQESFAAHPDCNTFFIGHSHWPRIFRENEILNPDTGRFFEFGVKQIINVGSVGQSRDKDPRACYVIIENGGFRFIRVPYDVNEPVRLILENPALDNFLAQRLLKGI